MEYLRELGIINKKEIAPLMGASALVTGSSRGIGKAIVIELARRGAIPIIHAKIKERRARQVAISVAQLGTMHGNPAQILLADITDSGQIDALYAQIETSNRPLDYLILNAAGGLERDKDANYPWLINVTAQNNLVEKAIDKGLIESGSLIVLVTSHVAKLARPGYKMTTGDGEINDFLEMYQPVADSKHLGELELRAKIPKLNNLGIKLIFLTGPLVTETPAVELYLKPQGKLPKAKNAFGLTTPENMAKGLVDRLSDGHFKTGDTIIVDRLALLKTWRSLQFKMV